MAGTPNAVVTAQTVMTAQATCTAAKTTYADTTNAVLLLTAGANGGVLYGIKGVPKGTNGGAGRLDVFSSLNGTTAVLLPLSQNFASYTQSTTAVPLVTDTGLTETAPRRLAPLEQIWVGTSIAPTAGMAIDGQYENL